MSGEGPTTTGSIVGKVDLDIAAALAKIEEVKAAVNSLGGSNSNPRIRVDSSGAVQDLSKIEQAATKAGTATDNFGKQASNAAKAPVPWMGILVGAISAVSPGIVAVGAAAIGLSAELTGLGAAGLLAFQGIQTGIAANLPMFAGLNDALDTVNNTLTNLEMSAAGGVLTGLSTALKTVQGDIGPVNSDVALLSGQLGGMLATTADIAVHAINGFTPVLVAAGGALQGFLQGIDGFTQSNGFTDFVNYTVARLPDVMHLLNDALGAVGGIFSALAPAGQSSLFLVSSLVDLIRSLTPVLSALMPAVIGASDALGGIALAAAAVLNVLGPLGPLVIGVVAAFFTWGTVGPIIAAISGALETVGTWIYVAADAAGVAAPAMRLLGVAVDSALGPIGLVVLALSLLAGALLGAQQGEQNLASSSADLTSALQQDSGAIGANVKALTAHQLISDGAAASGARLGLSLKTLTDAATGNAAATAKVNDATKVLAQTHSISYIAARRYGTELGTQVQDAQKVHDAVTQQNSALTKATDAYNKVAAATGNATMSNKQFAAAAAAVHMPVAEFKDAAAAQDKAAASAQTLRDKYILAGDAANLLKLDMDSLNGVSISNAEAQAAWASGIDSLATSFNKSSKAITGNSNAALENRGAVASLAATGETALQSIAGLSHSATQTTAAYKTMRGQLIQSVVDMGNSRAAATALVDQYFKIPKNIKTDFLGNDADAKAKAAAAKAAADDFAKGNYTAAYKADPTPANRAKADAMKQAQEFANGKYLAQLLANHVPASNAAQIARNAAQNFARDRYQATLYANNGPALAAAQSTVAQINAMRASIQVSVNAVGGNGAQVAKNALLGGKTGGTAGSASFGTMNSFRGMAYGGSPGGTVSGAGAASSDMAGLYRLANGEEVISNLFGQADRWRPLLKAINAGKVDYRAFERMTAHAFKSGTASGSHTTIAPEIHIHNPVAVDPIQQAAEAAQLALAYAGLG